MVIYFFCCAVVLFSFVGLAFFFVLSVVFFGALKLLRSLIVFRGCLLALFLLWPGSVAKDATHMAHVADTQDSSKSQLLP